jgi:hypothetical protein
MNVGACKLIVAIVLFAMVCFGFPQGGSGSLLSGTVEEAGSRALPGAEVRVRNHATGSEIVTVIGEKGDFSFRPNPGSYDVTVAIPSHKKVFVRDVGIQQGVDSTLQVILPRCNSALAAKVILNGQSVGLSDPTPGPPQAYDVAEAYEVYAAILPSEWAWRVANAKRLVIRRETTHYCMCLEPIGDSKKLMDAAIADYETRSQTEWLIQDNLKIEKPYAIITSDEISAMFQPGLEGYQILSQRYPDSAGYIQFSAVGFNAEKTTAVVYVGHHCGPLCGGGSFSVLQKKDGKWEPLKWQGNRCVWVS